MFTYHIHITGIVQGVGFRPLVCKLALDKGLKGWVCNDNDGVHIEFNAGNDDTAGSFYKEILNAPPVNAIIQKHSIYLTDPKDFITFEIVTSKNKSYPDLLLTPDIAICEDCKKEIESSDNKRFRYAFTTCLNCGPRYSITKSLPYDRENATMSHLVMCDGCDREYNDIYDRRHYSQTNSCPECEVPIHLYDNNRNELSNDSNEILRLTNGFLERGKILAVKGIGGYLLMCDATNTESVKTLRGRKHRPAKPFAVMYDTVEDIAQDVFTDEAEKQALLSKEAPIVLCKLREEFSSGIAVDEITKGLDKLGVFLPYSPLLKLITSNFKKPLIATSGNLSGSPIIYKDEDALQWLGAFADYIITFEREIVAPQDDSVVQFTKSGRRIVLRRSRGLAPNYIPNPFNMSKPILAMGAELKSAFALVDQNNLYISQFLGDQQSFESNESYKATLNHLQNLLKISPAKIIVDKHPHYNVSNYGREIAASNQIPIIEVQHHIAHFAAVLAENDLMQSAEKVLGIIWDGTGYGDDGQIWGGEFFLFDEGRFSRIAHLNYFPQLLGDKMSLEPRVSALALLHGAGMDIALAKENFVETEVELYRKILQREHSLLTSSMGRFLDGIASILKIQQINTFEGEAAMKLEVAAQACPESHFESYGIVMNDSCISCEKIVSELIKDRNNGFEISYLARKVFITLVKMIELVAEKSGVRKIAFSGGVFQNSFLCELIEEMMGEKFELIWHQRLSPNDECIGFGQVAWSAKLEV